ncbi:MAG TPA: universal stress protein [Phycisphaerales bacterium]|nr:universal stress protein [Phycisphaerales bacterium]
MLVTQKRPRDLAWYHAGPLLFGDWGTSRLYVLGLAFFYTGHASLMYLGAMSVLMAAVAWGYTIICRCFPDGGGVYTSSRQINHLLSVIAATMLLCDYVITASLSTVEAMHYFGLPSAWVVPISVAALVLIGGVNWLGARSAGTLAGIVAVAAMGASIVIAAACLRFVPEGLKSFEMDSVGPVHRWDNFIHIVLALSGVESVANMTGIMNPPVDKTSKRTIWPVLAEVLTLNLIFCIALNGLPQLASIAQPDALTFADQVVPDDVREYRDTAMHLLAVHTTTPFIASITSFIFGLLLLSASNTAVVAGTSVLFAMASDGELPRPLVKLNYSGVPWMPLIIACAMPIVVICVDSDVGHLADLYAVGVCGAITINFLTCFYNRSLPIGPKSRYALLVIGLVMLAVELTIIVSKPHATEFAGAITAVVLIVRWVLIARRKKHGAEKVPEPVTGWLAEINRKPPELDPARPRIMLAARGRHQSEFAIDLARRRNAVLFGIHVRTLRVLEMRPESTPRIEDDPEALESLGTTAMLAHQNGIPFVPIYVISPNIAEELLDYTVTFGCDTIIMGKTSRWKVSRVLSGDVVSEVAQHLPEGVSLVLRESKPHKSGGGKGMVMEVKG